MQDINKKLNDFFQPIRPLGQAFIIFFKTSIGILIICIIWIIITGKLLFGTWHQKLTDKRDFIHLYKSNQKNNHRRYIEDTLFLDTETELRTMDQEMRQIQQHMKNQLQQLHNRLQYPIKTNESGTIQTISQYSDINGQTRWYSLSIKNGKIEWTLTGTITEQLIENFQKANIPLTGFTFEAPYSIENLNNIIKILEEK